MRGGIAGWLLPRERQAGEMAGGLHPGDTGPHQPVLIAEARSGLGFQGERSVGTSEGL